MLYPRRLSENKLTLLRKRYFDPIFSPIWTNRTTIALNRAENLTQNLTSSQPSLFSDSLLDNLVRRLYEPIILPRIVVRAFYREFEIFIRVRNGAQYLHCEKGNHRQIDAMQCHRYADILAHLGYSEGAAHSNKVTNIGVAQYQRSSNQSCVASTFDSLMHCGDKDELHYAIGYCGSGVGMATRPTLKYAS